MEQNPPEPNSDLREPSPPDTGAPQADPDLMIDHLSYEETKDYVWRFVLAEKTTENSLRQKEQDLEQWKRRVALAQHAQDPTLTEAAQNQVKRLELEIENLKSEYAQLRHKNAILTEKLKLKAAQTPSVDAHQLLAELEMMADTEEHQLRNKLHQKEIEDELEKLKSRLKPPGAEGNPDK